MAIIITAGTAIYFNNKVVNLYEGNIQIYSNFIETLEAVDNDNNRDLIIEFNKIYAKGNSNNNQLKEPSILKESFMADYYQTQSNWLNTWLSALAIILAILAFIIPILFTHFLDERKTELERHCEKYEKTFDHLREETARLQKEMLEKIKEIDDAKKEMAKDIKQIMSDIKDEVKEASEYAKKAKKSEELTEANNLLSASIYF